MDSKHDVAAYKQLSPDEIDVMLRAWPNKAEREHLMELYRGVDGRTVTNEKDLLHPSFLANRAEEEKYLKLKPAVTPNPGADVLAALDEPSQKECHAISCHNNNDCVAKKQGMPEMYAQQRRPPGRRALLSRLVGTLLESVLSSFSHPSLSAAACLSTYIGYLPT